MRGDSVGVPARRLRLPASPSGAGHPLPDRGRHPHRHPRPLDVLRAGRRLVRERAGRGVRAGRGRSSEPLHPRDDPAARAASARARSNCSTRRTRTSRARSSTRSSPTHRSHSASPNSLQAGPEERHGDALRHRSRPQSGELPAADAAVVPGARGLGVSRPASRSSTARCGAATASSMRARAGSPRRCASAASGAATRSRSCSPTRRRCSNATTACR